MTKKEFFSKPNITFVKVHIKHSTKKRTWKIPDWFTDTKPVILKIDFLFSEDRSG